MQPDVAVGAVVVGVGGAFVFDFSIVDVTFVPIELVLHRIGLLGALGVIALGSAAGDRSGGRYRLVGAVAWLVGLALPLFGFL